VVQVRCQNGTEEEGMRTMATRPKIHEHTFRVVHPDWGVDYIGTLRGPRMMDPTTARVTMTSEGDGASDEPAYVYCAIPGGTPWMTMGERQNPIKVYGAPQCDTAQALWTFVVERWGQDEIDGDGER
jgi:hypothetical protein